MCGFTGTWNQRNETTVERCLNSLSHRGPDAQQSVHTPLFSVGHCRLAVIAPDATGKQPMWDTDKRFLLAFNGEIYNYRALRVELRNLGHAFHTQTDTEVLLYALKQWGHEAISKLNGCFAFAFFDAIRNTVLLARDQAGIKPLY
ncbi:MAG: asparagine synthetase B, partial [Flavobacteriales bacterium]|nr:asparagine synthetase B [Flavobacteriales bacterium]